MYSWVDGRRNLAVLLATLMIAALKGGMCKFVGDGQRRLNPFQRTVGVAATDPVITTTTAS